MAGEKVVYIRVSSIDQNTDKQLDGLELDNVFTDRINFVQNFVQKSEL